MKLGPLKSAIRDLDTAPKLATANPPERGLILHLQKTPLLAELDRLFGQYGRSHETNLKLTEDGFLMPEEGSW